MPARGKRGYVAKLENNQKIFEREVERDNYGSSCSNLVFELTEDGIYEVQDANFGSRKVNRYYLKLKDGEIFEESNELSDLFDFDLPELNGTQKQTDWADKIRRDYCAKLKLQNKNIHQRILTEQSAKFFIDNRDKLK